jgi:adenosylcobinamide-GDP ribazoletransferase
MKRGVCTGPWGVWKQPQRARLRGHWAVTWKLKGSGPAPWGEKLMGPQRCCADARGRLAPFTRHRSSAPGAGDAPTGAPAWLGDLAGAWIFYSVLPPWPWPRPRFERIARFAPWIGLVLGGLQALLWWLPAGWLPAPARLALVMALGLALTGGLHHDGALDTADGLAAGPRRRLEAMADSRVGAAAVQVALLLALLRAAGLACLLPATPLLGALLLVWAAFWGRLAPLPAMAFHPYLRREGSAAFHRRHWQGLARELRPALLALALLLALGWLLPIPLLGRWLGLLGLLPAWLVPWWLGRRLGGHSGDSYGASVEWTETLSLLLMGLAVARAAA